MKMHLLRRIAVLAGVLVVAATSVAADPDTTIILDRLANSPSLTMRYSGAIAALAELRVNGESVATKNLSSGSSSGETSFTLLSVNLLDGDNDVEVRLFDKAGRLLGSQKTVVSHKSGNKPTIFLSQPKMGATVQGIIDIKVGFGRDLKNSYVSYFVDKQFKKMSNVGPFTYQWDTSREVNGWHDLEAWVVDEQSETYKSKVLKVFVDNPGGRTNRRVLTRSTVPTIAPAPVAMTIPVSATPTTEPVVPKVPAIAAGTVLANSSAVNPGSASGVHASAVRSEMRSTTVIAAASVATPKVSAARAVAISNAIIAKPANPTGVRTILTTLPSLASGTRLMTPTGTRKASVAAPLVAKLPAATVEKPAAKSVAKPAPAVAKPAIALVAAKVEKPIMEIKATKPVVKTPPMTMAMPNTTDAVTGAPTTKVRSTVQGNSVPVTALAVSTPATKPVAKPVTVAEKKPIAPVSKPEVLVKKPSIKSVLPKPTVTAMIRIEKGVHIPGKGSFAVVMNGDIVEFDVQPRIDDGVPMAPLRHLVEKEGGKVEWEHATKEVRASADGNEIYIQVGARVAKVNNKAIDLDLTPYIAKGRTIVPLSFIRESLKVNVEYDKATGHVLITSLK